MRFKQFIQTLSESTGGYDWNGFKKVSDHLIDKMKSRYDAAIDAYQEGIQKKHMWNADFNDHYYGFSRGFEAAFEAVVHGWYLKLPRDVQDKGTNREIYYAAGNVNSIKKVAKLLPKSDAPEEVKSFIKQVETLPDMIKELKGHLVKGRKPKESDPNARPAFSPTFMPHEAAKVKELLSNSVEHIRKQYEDYWFEKDKKDLTKLWDSISAEDKGRGYLAVSRKITDSNLRMMLQRTVQNLNARPIELRHDWEHVLHVQVKQTVASILDGFLHKNINKLAAIVGKKSVKHMTVVRNRINAGLFENEIRFEFNDGSAFTVYSSAVFKRSNRGKDFVQYPTRFTNVKKADGTMMSSPTEEKMNKEF